MFTGIVEDQGVLSEINRVGSNIEFRFESELAKELKIDQSVSHNGVCLTVTSCSTENYTVTAIDETLLKTNLGSLKVGDQINLERCMKADGRFDGHMVYGHVDCTGECVGVTNKEGSYVFEIKYNGSEMNSVVEKGSICLNGISLTVFDTSSDKFSVAIIPYTFEHTSMKFLKIGDSVNLEFDILGKYIYTILQKQGKVF